MSHEREATVSDGERHVPWQNVQAGDARDFTVAVGESYLGAAVRIPVHVWRGRRSGPTVLVTAAVHGDEINGTGAIRHIIMERPFELVAGTLVLVPVVNPLGFERHSRYLPDRRDLNRCFPGSEQGSLASRLARRLFDRLVRHADYGIDLHTAAVRRTNFPNVRADLSIPELAAFARSFGAALLLDAKGPQGSLRRAATRRGCPTLILEAGEVWKVEPTVVEYAVRGIRNALVGLRMVDGPRVLPPFRLEVDSTRWVRAGSGGFLRFHKGPGDLVEAGELVATSTSLTGATLDELRAPRDAVILGMTTIPSVSPGDPVCHLAFPKQGTIQRIESAMAELPSDHIHERIRRDLARSLLVDRHDDPTTRAGDDP